MGLRATAVTFIPGRCLQGLRVKLRREEKKRDMICFGGTEGRHIVENDVQLDAVSIISRDLGVRLDKVRPRLRHPACMYVCMYEPQQKQREKHKHQEYAKPACLLSCLLACCTRRSNRCPAGRVFAWPSRRRTCGLGVRGRASCWGTETRSSGIHPSRLKLSKEAQYFRYKKTNYAPGPYLLSRRESGRQLLAAQQVHFYNSS